MEICWSTLLWDVYRHWSAYLAISVAFVVWSVLLAWVYEKPSIRKLFHKTEKQYADNEDITLAHADSVKTDEWNEDGSARINLRTLAEIVKAGMTQEQKDYEKAVEREQIAAIFKLLQEQEDNFQVSSMQQLEQQLNLYRQ